MYEVNRPHRLFFSLFFFFFLAETECFIVCFICFTISFCSLPDRARHFAVAAVIVVRTNRK